MEGADWMVRLTRRIESALRVEAFPTEVFGNDSSMAIRHRKLPLPGASSARVRGTTQSATTSQCTKPPTSASVKRTASWQELATSIDIGVLTDIRSVIELPVVKKPGSYDVAGRRFFDALARSARPSDMSLLVTFRTCSSNQPIEEHLALPALIGAFERWVNETPSDGALRSTTMEGYAYALAHILELLGGIAGRSYPKFNRREMTIPTGKGEVLSLGSLDWPEFQGCNAATRERLGLDIVRKLATGQFVQQEVFFVFGQDVLARDNPPEKVDAEAWGEVKRLLEDEQSSWLLHGHSQFHPNVPSDRRRIEIMRTLAEKDVWLRAGLPEWSAPLLFPQKAKQGRYRFLGWLCSACLGPTRTATLAVQTVLACTTGFNRSPIVELPREPFLFRKTDIAGIACAGFISSFKRRAGHEVMAYFEREDKVSGLARDRLLAEWRAAAADVDPHGTGDGHALLKNEEAHDVIDILERYRGMTHAARRFKTATKFDECFFFHISAPNGISQTRKPTIVELLSADTKPQREGASFQAIRKSFLVLKLREVGSASGVVPFACHNDTSSVMRHYLNTGAVEGDFIESIRAWQNSLQSLLVGSNPKAPVLLGLDPADLEWFTRLARTSGIAAAVGAQPVGSGEKQAAPLRFNPTPRNLMDLFLARLGLKAARKSVGPRRWKVQGLPLLALTQAIGLSVLGKGLRPAYVAAGRRALAALASGDVVLPPVLIV